MHAHPSPPPTPLPHPHLSGLATALLPPRLADSHYWALNKEEREESAEEEEEGEEEEESAEEEGRYITAVKDAIT